MPQTELHYLVLELGALAIVWAIEHKKYYLYGRFFKVFMDHDGLCYIWYLKNNFKFRCQVGDEVVRV